MKTDTLGRYILAAALFVSWAILLAAWAIVPALLNVHHQSYQQVRSELWYPLSAAAWLAFIGAVTTLFWPRLSSLAREQPATDSERTQTDAAS